MPADSRNIIHGHRIPCEHYSDQPYVVIADDGAWVCVLTTGKGLEGAPGQHVISLRSTDQGRTWTGPVDVEPADGPEASYAVLLKTPSGRIYCFYNHNTDNVREVKREDSGVYKRVDSLGHYVFKYSDDHGKTWSARRWDIPVREFECDRRNVYGGKLRFFWNVGRPLVLGGAAILVLHKVGAMGKGFFAQSEGAFLRSPNILTEPDPEKIVFETLPLGDKGLRTPAGGRGELASRTPCPLGAQGSGCAPDGMRGGRVAEEQSICSLSDGSLYCVYRTIDGHPACAYSRDGGETWTAPQYGSHTPGGRRIKHPRAANFVWRCSNGKFLYWFHNHGGSFLRNMPEWGPYDDRNPAWLCAGVERDSAEGKVIHWSQPEILLYDDDPFVRMSYPDLIEDGGRYFVTETQKNIARVHEIDPKLLEGLFDQWDNRKVATEGLILDLPTPREAPMPKLPEFCARDGTRPDYGTKDLRQGFTLDLRLRLDSLEAGQVVLDSRTESGKGLCLQSTPRKTVEIVLNDGRTENRWDCDPGVLAAGKLHHVAAVVDGGPKIITFLVDGCLCDGGEYRQFGWGRFSPHLRSANGGKTLRIGPPLKALRIYNRPLRTSEAVGNFRAGLEAGSRCLSP